MSGNVLIPVAIAGGGIIYVLAKRGSLTPTVHPPPAKPPVAGGGATPGATVKQLTVNSQLQNYGLGGGGKRPTRAPRNTGGSTDPLLTGGGGNQPGSQAGLEEKLHLGEQYVREQFANMNDVGKARAAEALNGAIGTTLGGHESWEEVAATVGAWAASAVGSYIGGPLGAKVGALLGAYLGIKLEEWINSSVGDIGQALGEWWSSGNEHVAFAEAAYSAGLITDLHRSLALAPPLSYAMGTPEAIVEMRSWLISTKGKSKPPYRKWPDNAAAGKHGMEHYAKRYGNYSWPGHLKGENPTIEYPNDW